MICNDWRFLCALGLTVTQQVLLAVSTYYIAVAGSSLGSGKNDEILSFISLFFFFALMAYIASSLAAIFTTRASNEAWRRYTNNLLIASTKNLQHASEKNKKSIAQWLSGEASSTISHACGFYLGMTSVCLNILLTLLVFYISIGLDVTLTMAASLGASLIFVMILRNKIVKSAGEMQLRRLPALLSIEYTWNTSMFGNQQMRNTGFCNLNSKIGTYFDELNKYTLLEQIVACCPIIISTAAIIALLQYSDIFTLSTFGILVAILPRSLQVFGNVHSLSIYLSQFFLVRTKIRNLESFNTKLDTHHLLHKTSLGGISVRKSSEISNISPAELITKLKNGTISTGRYTVTGPNGSGKTSFLKIIKSANSDALLMTPETNFLYSRSDLSTGQSRINEMENVISHTPSVLMLDEWDANLDDENRRRINDKLENASKRIVVIEVIHRNAVRNKTEQGAERS